MIQTIETLLSSFPQKKCDFRSKQKECKKQQHLKNVTDVRKLAAKTKHHIFKLPVLIAAFWHAYGGRVLRQSQGLNCMCSKHLYGSWWALAHLGSWEARLSKDVSIEGRHSISRSTTAFVEDTWPVAVTMSIHSFPFGDSMKNIPKTPVPELCLLCLGHLCMRSQHWAVQVVVRTHTLNKTHQLQLIKHRSDPSSFMYLTVIALHQFRVYILPQKFSY